MKQRRWAITNYAISIVLLLAIMFLKDSVQVIVSGFCIAAALVSQLALLAKEERWDGTHRIGLAYLLLLGVFMLLFIGIKHEGVTYLYGAVLILSAMALIVLELIAGWRGYKMLDRLANSGEEEEPMLEPLEPLQEDTTRLFAKQGSTTYHKEDCMSLQKTKVADLIQISKDEAIAYNMRPCRICKP